MPIRIHMVQRTLQLDAAMLPFLVILILFVIINSTDDTTRVNWWLISCKAVAKSASVGQGFDGADMETAASVYRTAAGSGGTQFQERDARGGRVG